MAIRKFRKMMKPVIFVVAIAMIGSGVWLTFTNLLQHRSAGETQYAYQLNGEKISKIKIAREENALLDQLNKMGQGKTSKDLISLIAFQKVINDELTLQLAEDMKIKVPSSEVKEEYEKIEESIGNKEQFKRMLSVQGYSKKSFQAMLQENLLLQKVMEKFEEEGKKAGKDGNLLYQEALAKKRNEMKLEKLAPEYEKLQMKVVEEKDGFKITNVDMADRVTQLMLMTGEEETKVTEEVKKQFEEGIAFAKKAQERGVVVSKDLPINVQLAEYAKVFFEKLKSEVQVDELELSKFFKANHNRYNQHASIDVNVAVLKIAASKEDIAAIEKKAEEILQGLTKENFAKTGEELQKKSTDTVIYEELGWFEKGAMVKEFEEAAFSSKEAQIYPKVISTQFGKHLLYIQEVQENKVKAAHILFREVASQDSIAKSLREAETMKEKLDKKEVTFETLKNINKNLLFTHMFTDVDKSGMIPGFVNDTKLVETMYAAEMNKVQIYADDYVTKAGIIYLFSKTKEVQDKVVSLEEVRDKVQDEYKAWRAQQELQKLMN
ncbi:PpiC-type peptidyl-prolyl cis-trans isomerase [Fusobacterium necrophorum subsp. funduliforme B35]|uniref:peptidylprolyl isomerase n=1 Tax=Fusobacterium necrophorum TaxID=859 RepID=UPI0004336293|nr:SurA N-terminal domain-containing protein [Fusobacterium necrophorum]EYD69053.1 PpiC-type peptidyl-prolyl cis-trans isomerase [Fusobacterium necrophorum subsp. funduliforme B35]